MLQLTAKLMNIYKANDFVNKETGEVTVGKTKLQLLQTIKMKNGAQKHELIDLSIPDHKATLFKDKVGKEVTVEVSIMAKSYKFYGV